MSCNFYKNSGFMVGIDIHKFYEFPNVPIEIFPHFVAAPLASPSATYWKRTVLVYADRYAMIQGGFDLYFVSHIPLPLPGAFPGSREVPHLVEVILDSGSKAQLQAHSVTGEGNPLAVCVFGPVGLNANCFEYGLSASSGIVTNLGTVKTTPTAGDYAGAIAGMIVDSILGFALDRATSGSGWVAEKAIKHLWRRIGDIPFLKVLDVPSHVQNFVQQLVDGELGEAGKGP